jgi:tRNA G10  N-methylase Trm11
MTVLDPCCGSGTIPAMAAALGAQAVWGTDLRKEFLAKALTNFHYVGIDCHMPASIEEGEGETKTNACRTKAKRVKRKQHA